MIRTLKLGWSTKGHGLHAVFCQDGRSEEIALRNSWGSYKEYIRIKRDHDAIERVYEVEITKLVQQKLRVPDEEFHTAKSRFQRCSAAHQLLKPGLNIQGRCRGRCRKMVWCNLGKNSAGDDLMLMPGRCPSCSAGLENGGSTLGFYQCSWQISGFYGGGNGKAEILKGESLRGTVSPVDGFQSWQLEDIKA